jgi:hypothetical protein
MSVLETTITFELTATTLDIYYMIISKSFEAVKSQYNIEYFNVRRCVNSNKGAFLARSIL